MLCGEKNCLQIIHFAELPVQVNVYKQCNKMLPGLVSVRISRLFYKSARSFVCARIRVPVGYGQTRINIVGTLPQIEIQAHRFKYTKKRESTEEDEDDDIDSVSEVLDPLDKSISTKKCNVTSLRVDLIIKAGMGMARNKVETAFYESRIRVNGKKILKKSVHVNVGDEIDIIRGPSSSNPDFLVVTRIELLSAAPKDDSVVVHLKRHKNLVVENYDEPWRGSLA
ncbi:mitochondrial transcription rescue factor 1 [Schistocerca americana]|uniref:mitochondrial transcription rescue factor 1 n=1 Tax=Schistocerca americana TaxID=7009 RepID=UPI001F4FD4D6|nr:mitochondrial transcription rescue factor 1 [Schistocerca americana]